MMLRPLLQLRHVRMLPFIRLHRLGFGLAILLSLISIVLVSTRGLNYGIDFRGGTLIEARATNGPADLAALRTRLDALGLGQIALQNFGSDRDVLIRVPRQSGDDKAQMVGIQKVRDNLGKEYEQRRVEVVGPKVGGELIQRSLIATILALVVIAIYVAFRFEWQFGVGTLVAILHGTITTAGLFALLQLEFNLASFAAILTIAGYSINDTVVIYDRIRENIRKYRTMDLSELINLSLNETLSRTILTAGTVVLSVLALLLFGGQAIRGFSAAMLWGVVIGTYSSIFIAAPMLLYIQPPRGAEKAAKLPATSSA